MFTKIGMWWSSLSTAQKIVVGLVALALMTAISAYNGVVTYE